MHLNRDQTDEEVMLEIAEKHEFGSLREYELELHGSLPLSSIKPFKGYCVEMELFDIHNQVFHCLT